MRFVTLTKDIFSTPKGERPSEERTWVREVYVDDMVVRNCTSEEQLLELIFYNGQNDFQAKTAPSLSTGDLIVVGADCTIYRIKSIGFWFEKVDHLTRMERTVMALAARDLDVVKVIQWQHAEVEMRRSGASPQRIEEFRKSCTTRG